MVTDFHRHWDAMQDKAAVVEKCLNCDFCDEDD
jgi:hypothetical protein